MAEEEKDKSEPATPFKLEEARRRGQVARSIDFVTVAVVAALVASVYAWALALVRNGARLGAAMLDHSHEMVFSPSTIQAWIAALLVDSLAMMLPFFAAAAVAAVLANMVQSGIAFTAFPLKPDLQRINPVNGFKRLFSLRTVYEGVKTLVKLVALGVAAYIAIAAALASLLQLQHADAKSYLPVLTDHAGFLLFVLLAVLVVIGLIDFAYNRWDFSKRMMMSHREIREEVKRREGDPMIRARLRELRQEAAKRAKSLKRVPEADVLITNPDHYAVALRYDRDAMAAPHVTAKGVGELARAMKALAVAHAVPMFENRALARRLYAAAAIDQPVAGEFFESVARIYARVFAAGAVRPAVEARL
jgi:flagellar biosynthesis protein FlhB